MSDPAWAPTETAPGQLFAERTWLEGAIMLAVAYGVQLTIFTMTFDLLFRQTNRSNWKQNASLLLYISMLFILGTLFMAAAARMTQLAFIDNRNFPGGPSAYEQVMFSIPVDNLGNVAFVMANWLADGLMVWRWLVIYRGCGVPVWVIMMLPCAMLTGSFVIGVLFLVQISAPASSPWATSSVNFTLPYFCLSLALNIISTIVIVIRLFWFRRRVFGVLGSAHGSQYTNIAAMIIESAALYSTCSLLFLVPFVLNHPIQNTFLQMLSPVQVIAPLLIIFRVAQGRAWSASTANEIMSSHKSTLQAEKIPRLTESTDSSTLRGFSASGRVSVNPDIYTMDSRGLVATDKVPDSF